MLLNHANKCPCGGYVLTKMYWQYEEMRFKKECINPNCPFTVKDDYKYGLSNNSKPIQING